MHTIRIKLFFLTFSVFNHIFVHLILFFYRTWKWPLTVETSFAYNINIYQNL